MMVLCEESGSILMVVESLSEAHMEELGLTLVVHKASDRISLRHMSNTNWMEILLLDLLDLNLRAKPPR